MRRTLLAFLVLSSVVFASISDGGGRVDPATHLAALAQQADAVTIEFREPDGTKREVAFSDVAWLFRLERTLARGSYQPQSLCLCISWPTIRLFREKKQIAQFSVHHDVKLRAFAGQVSGDFLVGEAMGKAIMDLAQARKKG